MTNGPAHHLRIGQPDGRPGDGSVITATNISIVTYAGDGLWCRQEDIYNPLRFLRAGMKWCRKRRLSGRSTKTPRGGCRECGGSK